MELDISQHFCPNPDCKDYDKKGRIVKVERRIGFGKEQDINKILENSLVSQAINTSFVERNNLTLRQHIRCLTRKTKGFLKVLRKMEAQLILVMAYYNFVLSHCLLKIKGKGECTPAMAAESLITNGL